MFYGMTLNSFMTNKKMINQKPHEDAYQALRYADKQWYNENDDSISTPRLLAIMTDDSNQNPPYAFFEFSCHADCINFIKQKSPFLYSPEENKIWNGTPHLMHKTHPAPLNGR